MLSRLARVADNFTAVAPQLLRGHSAMLLLLAAVATLATAGAAAASRLKTKQILATRTDYVLLPAKGFDPGPAQLQAWAVGLIGARRHGRRLGVAAETIRLSMKTVPPGRIGFFVNAPARAMPAIRQALPAGVLLIEYVVEPDPDWPDPFAEPSADELVPVQSSVQAGDDGHPQLSSPTAPLVLQNKTTPPEAAQQPEVRRARARLTLSQPDEHPLACELPRGFEMKGAWGNLASTVEDDETFTIHIDLLPLHPSSARRWSRRLAHRALAHHARGKGGKWDAASVRSQMAAGGLSLSRGPQPASRPLRQATIRRPVEPQAKEPIRKSVGPLFRTRILVEATATNRRRATQLVHSAMAPFHQWAGQGADGRGNHLKAVGIPLPGGLFLGDDLPGLRRRFDRVAQSGLFAASRRWPRISSDELGQLMLPFSQHYPGTNVLRDPGTPDGLLELGPGVIPLGIPEGKKRPVGVPANGTFFGYWGGKSRAGKTSAALTAMLHLARNGEGVVFIDPHRDAMALTLPFLGPVAKRVIVIDLTQPWETMRLPGWNPIDVRGLSAQQADSQLAAVIAALQAGTGWNAQSTQRAMGYAAEATGFLMALSRALPPQAPAPTIHQIPTVLTNEDWRQSVLEALPRHVQAFWRNEYGSRERGAELPVTRFFRQISRSLPTQAMLGAPRATLNLREAIDERSVILFVPPRTGEEARDQLPTSLFGRMLLQALLSRADVPAPERPKRCPEVFVFGDELQVWDGPDIAGAFEESGKFGGRIFVMNQNPVRLSESTRAALGTNASIISSHAQAADGAKIVTTWWGDPNTYPGDLVFMPRFHFRVSVTLDGTRTLPFNMKGLQPSDLFTPDPGITLESLLQGPRYMRAADVAAGLEDLEERIVQAVDGQRPAPKRKAALRAKVAP